MRLICGVLLAVVLITSCAGPLKKINLVIEGKSSFKILYDSLNTEDKNSAVILRNYIQKISGAELRLISNQNALDTNLIIIGAAAEKFNKVDLKDLEADDFCIISRENNIILSGQNEKSTRYAVYTFLEDFLDCRNYGSGAVVIPKSQNIAIPIISKKYEPAFSYRELHFPDPRNDEEYLNWHKLELKKGENEWGMFVHTFDDLIPSDKYFKSHPEYFSWMNVKRIPGGQLCLTNPEVFKIVVSELKRRMAANPRPVYWSVSQNDNYDYCRCDNCKAAYKKYGSISGLYIEFVNRIAEKFPDKIISTLAYQFTRSAPQNIKPEKNVNIMLCSIECNRSKSIASDPSSESFRKDVEDWCNLTNNIFMWDYVVQFRSLLSPFPNLRVLQPNIKYFHDHGIKMMFQQGSGDLLSEFYELREYIIAKLLWDPDADVDGMISDFLDGYYGPAGKYIGEYVASMHNALENTNGSLGIYGFPFDGIDTYLTPELIRQYEEIFRLAERSAAEYPEYLDRVKIAKLPLEFAEFDISLHNVNNDLTFFKNGENGRTVRKEMLDSLDNFTAAVKAAGIQRYWEHGNLPDEYNSMIKSFIEKSSRVNHATGKQVKLLTQFSSKYDAGGASALTDGLRGMNDYHFNWLGFEGNDMIAVVDLEKPVSITSIQADFLQDQNAWIFLPKSVEFSISNDGINFNSIGIENNKIPENEDGVFIEEFKKNISHVTARFIKLKASSLKECPSWHKGAGGLSWIFCDEIVVN